MRILIFTQYFWPETFRVNDLALALQESGHTVTVLTGMPSYPKREDFSGYGFYSPKQEDFHGIKVYRVPLCSRGKGGKLRLVINYLSFVFFAGLLAPFRCSEPFDVIFMFQTSPITSALPALWLGWLRKKPVIMWVQDLWPETLQAVGVVKSPRLLKLLGYGVQWIYRRCAMILTPTQEAMQTIVQRGIPAEKVRYFPNWAEALYKPVSLNAEARQQLKLPAGFCIMFAGNIGVAQSFETILAAAKQLQNHTDIHWVILGEGRQFAWLKTQINQLSLAANVHLLGRKQMEQMPVYFSCADVLLVTLRKDPIFALTIPSKVQSYLACGKPILAALDGAGARIISESHAGLVGPAEDVESMVNHVLALYYMSPQERAKMGANAYRYYQQHFERERLVGQLEGWLDQVVEGDACEY